jgi:hypothetical protein
MKRKGFWVGIIIGIIAGVLASIPISYWLLNYEAYILPQLNLVEVANLVMTLLLAVGIPLYIQNQIDNKKIIKDLIIEDIRRLIDNYCDNTTVLMQLQQNSILLSVAQEKIRFVFHRGDLIVDGITAQLGGIQISKDKILITEITQPYYRYLTNGNLYENSFVIDKDFIQAHEVELQKVTRELKMVIQKLILN